MVGREGRAGAEALGSADDRAGPGRRLPDIPVVRDRSRSLAMLDAILSPQWEYRYYSFNGSWGPAQELASMRNGSGDDYAVVFSPAGAWVRVLIMSRR
jgi:hypothetical protein